MGKSETIAEKAEAILAPITDGFGVSIFDVEYVLENGERYLRAYIDKEGGVTIDDCENVSRAFDKKLDEEDFIDEQYILEVSSPGLGRSLTKDRHLEKSIGKMIEIHFYKTMVICEDESTSVKSKAVAGLLESFDPSSVTIKDEESGRITVWNRSDIAQIKLALDF